MFLLRRGKPRLGGGGGEGGGGRGGGGGGGVTSKNSERGELLGREKAEGRIQK